MRRMTPMIATMKRSQNDNSPSAVPVYGIRPAAIEPHLVLVIFPREYTMKGVL